MFKYNTSEQIINKILNNINKFGLLRTGVKQNTEESNLYKPRYLKMRDYANQTKDICDLYSCIFYAFSQQMRFNQKGNFNMPFGNGAFTENNEQYILDGCKFFSQNNVNILNNNFRCLKPEKLTSNDFVYLDPLYFDTTATYNENGGWTEQDENDLYELCENLTKNNIKFAMSNVFENKGHRNTKLIDWVEKNNYNVYTFDKFTYSACGKGNSNAKEVLITNY